MDYKEYIEQRIKVLEAAQKVFSDISLSNVIQLSRLSLQPKILEKTVRIKEKLSKELETQVEPTDFYALMQILMLVIVREFGPFKTIEDLVNNSLTLIEELLDNTIKQ